MARAQLAEFCAGLHPEVIETATLLVSELVTNAVRHAQGNIRVRARRHRAVLRVEVSDELTGVQLHAQLPPPSATRGRGLVLVEELASKWGVTQGPDGKTVWFHLDLASG
jgi:anti-sigma regulatory factor (Ser/Thr protein kinase)